MADIGHESILGLDNIRLDLPVAGLGSRSLAATLDYLALAVLVLLWVLVCVLLFSLLAPRAVPVFLLGGLFLLDWGYFAASEIATGGKTLGKRALQLRVVTAEGGTPSAGALLIRNLVRSIDLLVGVLLMAFDPLSRRLGDRLAGTLVIHDRPPEVGPLLGRVPPGWGARELAAVEALLARAGTIEDPALVRRMADRVLDRIRRDAPGLLAGVDTGADPLAAIRQALQVETGGEG
ncbi:MAG TPA: RDD family protein [Thermoanaerobaculia bacterium]|nr:RDD family protein [Thermoanaerobaculia bacterium]